MSKQDPKPTRAGTAASGWRTVDLVVTAVLGVAFGVVFWAWNTLWVALDPAFKAFPPGQAFMYGVWLVPGVLAMLVVRKPGAAIFAMVLASTVSALLGSQWGTQVIWYGVLEGLAPELVFLAFRYRRFALPVALMAGAAAGLTAFGLDRAGTAERLGHHLASAFANATLRFGGEEQLRVDVAARRLRLPVPQIHERAG